MFNKMFLYIDPLKQGLKQEPNAYQNWMRLSFLYIDPLKQGLKQEETVNEKVSEKRFYT